MLSLSYLRTQSDESFSEAELYKNVGLKCPVIDITRISIKTICNMSDSNLRRQPRNTDDFHNMDDFIYDIYYRLYYNVIWHQNVSNKLLGSFFNSLRTSNENYRIIRGDTEKPILSIQLPDRFLVWSTGSLLIGENR